MADNDENRDAAPAKSGRPRAPTITIDTTAMSPSSAQDEQTAQNNMTQSPISYAEEGQSPVTAVNQAGGDSRPTSPHNVSSPVTSRDAQGFLAVPHHLRSRQNSVDSEGSPSPSFVSSLGETMTPSHQGDLAKPSGSTSSQSSAENDKIMNDPDALKPDQGREQDFTVEDNPFAFSPGMLNKMFNPKSLSAFFRLGGLAGLEAGLLTDRKSGLSMDETSVDRHVSFEEATSRTQNEKLQSRTGSSGHASAPHAAPSNDAYSSRKRVFSDNRLPEKKGKSLWQLMWITYNDKVLLLLSGAAVVSLAIGLYQTFSPNPGHEGEPRVEWVEGVAILVAIAIVVLVGSLNDYQKERQFARLNKKKQDRLVKVKRSGKTQEISVFDLFVGDVVHLEPGDMVPVDGVLIEGFNVKCDESQATGESDIIRKRPADEVFAAISSHQELKKMDPFIQSGARVMEGVGTFMVTSTGIYSTYGRTMMSLDEDPEITPLQVKLNIIAEWIAKAGGVAGLVLFGALFIKFLAQLPHNGKTPAEKGQQFLNIIIMVVTIIVVAVPEGLPLAVTLALAFATTRMLRDKNLVRHLKACEVMGNATTICSDKTGTLTQNKMQVVAGTIGSKHTFGSPSTDGSEKDHTLPELVDTMNPSVKDMLLKSISLNSTAFEGEEEGVKTFVGSKTETALLIMASEHLGMGPVSLERSNAKIVQMFPFDSKWKCMGVAVQHDPNTVRLLVKGASEIMVEKCTRIVRDATAELGPGSTMTNENRESLKQLIELYANNSLRTIGIIYRDFAQWPPRSARRGAEDEVEFSDLCQQMTFLGMVGIKDPLRPGVPEAVRECQRAGVVVRMVTGDNVLTAQAIARDCGILTEGGLVMEGPVFRNLPKTEQDKVVPRLRVLARSAPDDKRILVKRLKDLGETVAVTGDGTNDAPALKMADIGFSMGIAGTEVAKEASAIILMDDNFTSIVQALKWGRAVSDAVKRFLQFQLTVNVTAVLLTFVSAVSNDQETSVLTAVQLLWVNLIMDTLAALALATDPPTDSLLDRPPDRKGSSIISTTMWKMIIGQAIYQLVITFLLLFMPPNRLPGIPADANDVAPGSSSASQLQSLIFNTFVWMQIFNQWNNRRLDNKFNVLEGITKNKFFMAISAIMMGGQTLIMFVGGAAFSIAPEKQTGVMWAYALVLGFLSIPVGALIRLIPDAVCEKAVPGFIRRRFRQSEVPGFTVAHEDGHYYGSYPAALAEVREELAFIKAIKGGRLNNLKFAMRQQMAALKSPPRSRELSRANSMHAVASAGPPPRTPSRENSVGSLSGPHSPDSRHRTRRSNSVLGATVVMPGIVAGGIVAGSMANNAEEKERE